MSQDREIGDRYNEGKLRYDLLEPFAMQELARVFSKGAEKYDDNNWLKGLPWTEVVASLKRHIAAFEMGEDFDKETQCYHMAHAAWNTMAILSYYKHRPEFDNRAHAYLRQRRIGLDIDEVLTKWIDGYKKVYDYPEDHNFDSWYLHYNIIGRCEEDLGNEFYANLEPKISAKELPFEPHCYVTSRNIDTAITEDWLYRHGFPCRPVYTVGLHDSKVEVLKNAGVEIFVDDVYRNFVDINKEGICCYLWDAPHNQRFDVGHKRLYDLKQLV